MKSANDDRYWHAVPPLMALDPDQARRVARETKQSKRQESVGGIFILACLGILTGSVVGSLL